MTSSPRASDPGTSARTAAAIVALATLARMLLAFLFPAGVDEAYSIGIARQLSLSYFDHPPLHLWIVGLWAKLIDSEAIGLLRLPFIALGILSSVLLWRLTRTLYDAHAALWAVALFNLAPIFGVAHGTFVLPDGPLIAAALGLAVTIAPLALGRDLPPSRWLVAGVCAGLAMLSKYHGLILVGGVFLFLLATPRRLFSPGPWIAALVAAVLFVPVLVWNAQHDWVSFGFQAGRGTGSALRPLGPLESLLQQSGYLLPWLAFPAAWALFRALRRGPAESRSWLLAYLALPPILIFTGATLFNRGLPHWQMPGWLFTLPLLAAWLTGFSDKAIRWCGRAFAASAALVWAFVAVLLLQLHTGILTPALGGKDPTDPLVAWTPLTPQLLAATSDGHSFVAALDWITAGELNYALGGRVPVTCLCADARHFRYLVDDATLAGWTGILVTRPGQWDNSGVANSFETVGPATPVGVDKNGHTAIALELRVGTDYRPASD